ncbi:response regulator transcription factor [uncultured Hoeflea sp.]|uniref:response regulator n=1 Tax=uncultured Hoeflea sp. TaxID=538666 RepID=UPI0026244EFA|nr:response regulator transcription factor [uncultured Hoeflea sp.]
MHDHILVVDDDGQLTSFLKRFLTKQGYVTSIASSAAQAISTLSQHEFDLIVLDLILPDVDGLEIAQQIRRDSNTPIIMLTARDDVFDRIVGLELGADDYLTKPYEPRELLARIKAVLRRYQNRNQQPGATLETSSFGDFELNFKTHQLRRISTAGTIPLTGAEFILLGVLAENAGNLVPRAIVRDRLYGNNANVTDRAIDAHVARLRKKMDSAGSGASIIRTVHGKGYVLSGAGEAAGA